MKLIVCLEGAVAGVLQGDGTRATFAYAPEWLESPGIYPLSQSMPTAPTLYSGRRVLNFLWGLLPDNARILEAWGRRFQVSPRNPIALLSHVGEDCAGAVQFVTEARLTDVLESAAGPMRIEWFEGRQLEDRIRDVTGDGAAARTATEGQFSLAGAQSKIALYFDARRERWGIPSGRTPTTHILKPATNDFDGFAENEHFCLALARRIGLAAAKSEWQSIGGIPTLILERYDRMQQAGHWHRIHQEDCCQALGVHPDAKYENEGGPGYPELLSLLNATDEPEADRQRLMAGACLGYLLAATDMHAKNFSLLHARGTARPSLRLAPFYDMASAWPYPRRLPTQKIKLALRIGGHYRLREILPRHFRKLAVAGNYSPDALIAMLGELSRRLPDEAGALLKENVEKGMSRPVLTRLVDGVAAQCRLVQRQLGDRTSRERGER
jgi:serine/threonine-protein kinase HipA